MKQLSRWGSKNPKLSRAIITISYWLVFFNAVGLGILLFLFDWNISNWLIPIFGSLFFIAFIFYPKKNSPKNRYISSYTRRKIHDFSLIMSYAVVVTLGVGSFLMQGDVSYNSAPQPRAEFMMFQPNLEKPTTHQNSFFSKVKRKTKSLKKQTRQQFRAFKKAFKRKNNGKVRAGQVALIMITILGALFLGLVVGVLACGISCSGSGGLALATLILGWGGIIALSVIVIKAILRRGSNKDKESKEAKTS